MYQYAEMVKLCALRQLDAALLQPYPSTTPVEPPTCSTNLAMHHHHSAEGTDVVLF